MFTCVHFGCCLKMPFFDRDNLRFHYLERGKGVPFIFQHGLGGDSDRIFSLLNPPPAFRLLGLDCRAHGETRPLGPEEKLGFDSFADDLIGLMDFLDLQHAILGGTSMGAGVALNCALRYPHRRLGLVLLRPAWLDHPLAENVVIFATIASLIRRHGPEKGAKLFQKSDLYSAILRQSSDATGSLLELFLNPRSLETVARLERIPTDVPNRDRTEWRKIAAPTLVLANRSDPIHPFEYGSTLAREIPSARLIELTPKSVNLAQYTAELRAHIDSFLQHYA